MKPSGILIVAERPKLESNHTQPMVGTKSFNTLTQWLMDSKLIKDAEPSFTGEGITVLGQVTIINATDAFSGPPNAGDLAWVKENVDRAAIVVTLGSVAEESALTVLSGQRRLYVPTLVSLPHPSGLNRALNSAKVRKNVRQKLDYVKRLSEVSG